MISKKTGQKETEKTKRKYILIISTACLFGLFFIVLLSLLVLDQAYAEKIYPRINIEGVNISGKNKDKAGEEIKNISAELLDKKIEFRAENESPENYSYSDLGVSYESEDILNQIWQIGHKYTLGSKIKALKTIIYGANYTFNPQFNQEKLDKTLNDYINITNIAPQNAEIRIDSGKAEITKGKEGQAVNMIDLDVIVKKTIKERSDKILVKYQTEKPKIEEKDLSDALFQAQTWLNQSIALTFEGNSYPIDSDNTAQWIKFAEKDSKINAELDEDKIKSYLDSIAKKIDVAKKDRQVNGVNHSVIDEGYDGRVLNRDQAIEQIINSLNQKASSEIALEATVIEKGEKEIFLGGTTGLFPGKYIEVDLSDQKLFRIEGDNVISENSVSTGKWSMPTPKGTFSIQSKIERAYSATYDLYMPYWMAFIDSQYGIHALPEWPDGTKEGESHLGHPVSHGCIRLGDDAAKTVYEWTEEGIPVVVHD